MASARIEDIKFIDFPKVDHYALVGWLGIARNIRKEYFTTDLEMRVLRDRLVPMGWDTQQSAIVEVATEEEVKEILAARELDLERLKADLLKEKLPSQLIPYNGTNISVPGRDYALAHIAVFEWCFKDKKGKWMKPIALGTTANRRSSVLTHALTVQLLCARKDAGDDKLQPADVADKLFTHISVKVPDTHNKRFPDAGVRMQCQFRENENKLAGFKGMNDAERLVGVMDLVQNHGKGQTDIRNTIDAKNPSLGIRCYFAILVELYCQAQVWNADLTLEEKEEWKNIRFLARLQAPKYLNDEDRSNSRVNPDWLDFGKFDQKAFQGDGDIAMGLMVETDEKFAKENKRREAKNLSPLVRPDAKAILAWIQKQITGDSDRAKPVMARAMVKGYSGSHDNPFTKDAMKAVDENKEHYLARAKERALVCKYVYSCKDNCYEMLALAAAGLNDLSPEDQLIVLAEFRDHVMEAVEVAKEARKAKVKSETESEEVENEEGVETEEELESSESESA